jgi:signal transduction histidine kinase
MARRWLWLQLALAWLPMWALFTALIVLAHGLSLGAAAFASARMIAPGALLGYFVYKLTSRIPWPHPFRSGFIGIHILAAILYAIAWLVFIVLLDGLITGHVTTEVGPGAGLFLVAGVWLYIVVAGVAYANQAAQRNAKLESHAARMQLAELRAQLHPHFLFNALHTIVQLIPVDPRTAIDAAERLGEILRGVLERNDDLVPLAQELSFVERVVGIERIRFGERLVVRIETSDAVSSFLVPSFSVQTLLENAVRHGASPRVETTHVSISAHVDDDSLIVRVVDDGVGTDVSVIDDRSGTGLRRLRERLKGLYGNHAKLDIQSSPAGGFTATLKLPLLTENPDD